MTKNSIHIFCDVLHTLDIRGNIIIYHFHIPPPFAFTTRLLKLDTIKSGENVKSLNHATLISFQLWDFLHYFAYTLCRVFFLLFRPKKWLSVRLHNKSHQKSSKCQNFLGAWHLSHFKSDQYKKTPRMTGVYILPFISILVFIKNCHF